MRGRKDAAAGMTGEAAGWGSRRVVHTLGTSTRSIEEFIAILRSRGIARVADVRSFPTSRRYPHFSSQPLAASLEEAGIAYLWLGKELGGYRSGGYRAYMETPGFLAGIEGLEEWASQAPAAVVCAELLPSRCHRRFIAAVLEGKGWTVVHAIDAVRDWAPPRRGETAPMF